MGVEGGATCVGADGGAHAAIASTQASTVGPPRHTNAAVRGDRSLMPARRSPASFQLPRSAFVGDTHSGGHSQKGPELPCSGSGS